MKTALLLIDIQNDYFPGGANPLVGAPEAASNAGALLASCRAEGLPVFHIQHISTRPGASFCLPDTEGANIHASVQPLPGEPVFQKHFPNSFRETPLLDHLHQAGITRLLIAGMMTHMCVESTTRAAADLGFSCVVLHDACATKDLTFLDTTVPAALVHAAALAALNGVFGEVKGVGDVVKREE